jgi:cell division protein FtsQ
LIPVSRDPAPSRLRYRMQRWMLTPGIRRGLKLGLPLAILLGASIGYLADPVRRDALLFGLAKIRDDIQERPEFMVSLMAIDGAGPTLSEDIREVLPLDFPISSFDLDLEEIRNLIAGLDPVRSVSVRIRPGGVLQIDVTERVPVLVWRTREGVQLLDETGAHIEGLPNRAARMDLPLIAGDGADKAVQQALALYDAARPLGDRLRGFVRIGERRWDVVLDRDQRILLPSDRPVRALERVIALNQAQDMMDRDVAIIDMRLADRPTLRMTAEATQNWWRIRDINQNGQ